MSIRSSRCVFTTATALHRVFVAPIEGPQGALVNPLRTSYATSSCFYKTQHRYYASGPPPKRRLPRNKEISSTFVHIVSPDGKLSAAESTWSVLNSIDTSTHTLVTVALPTDRRSSAKKPFDDDEDGEVLDRDAEQQGVEFPICKIVGNKELWEMEKQKTKKKAKSPSATLKTIELNWAIDGNDLKHRLDRIREFLEKGYRVEVMIAGKRKGRKATIEEAEGLLTRVRAITDDVPGSRENKAMEGKVTGKVIEGRPLLPGQVTVYFEGKLQEK